MRQIDPERRVSPMCGVLILGASYGSLMATKLLLAGHDVQLACLPEEADLINADGTRVRMPVKGQDRIVEVDSRRLPGRLSAASPGEIRPEGFDLVVLAMQEPHYRAAGVKALLDGIGRAGVPCLSIMNMPPPPYLQRIPALHGVELEACYTDPTPWRELGSERITLCSPDPQASRPPGEPLNVLQVGLATNFKAARFEAAADTELLLRLASDIEAARFDGCELPVKLKVHDSVFVPLAKWPMLLAGNYRCVTAEGTRSMREAVHDDLASSREIYLWVQALCRSLGAAPRDEVPFEKYALAAQSLSKPSSAARALAGGATAIERVDRLVQAVASRAGLSSPAVDEIVARVDARLAANRKVAAS